MRAPVACILVAVLGPPWFSTAAGVDPAAEAAFNSYVKTAEENFAKRTKPNHFLWLDDHRPEKSLVWMNQSFIIPVNTLEGGSVQDWLGAIYLDGATLDRVRDMVLNFPGYKFFFKQQVSESRLVKRDGDRFDAFLRVHRRQVLAVELDIDASAQFTAVDPSRVSVAWRSEHIVETKHPEDDHGYLWRLNIFWRLQQEDNGVYAEVELMSLSRPAGVLSTERFLKGFTQNFTREFTEGLIEGLHRAFPRPR